MVRVFGNLIVQGLIIMPSPAAPVMLAGLLAVLVVFFRIWVLCVRSAVLDEALNNLFFQIPAVHRIAGWCGFLVKMVAQGPAITIPSPARTSDSCLRFSSLLISRRSRRMRPWTIFWKSPPSIDTLDAVDSSRCCPRPHHPISSRTRDDRWLACVSPRY